MLASGGTVNDVVPALSDAAAGNRVTFGSAATVRLKHGRTLGHGSKAKTRPPGPTCDASWTV